ncbi:MAG: MarR family transcriptional regulator [Streptomycetaceae bacterium]|nr:MarR family transcriptional regulator [Streptomycetaceae bacterium]
MSQAPDSVDRAAAAEVRRGVTRLAHRLRTERPAEALSGNKIAVLAYLHRHGPAAPGAIAAAEHQQPQSLTRVFAALRDDGLIDRDRSGTDGRAVVLTLTDRGREALARDMAERDAWLVRALATLSPAEAGILRVAAALMDQLADTDAR